MKKIFSLHSPWIFFVITFGISWLFWIPAGFIDANIQETSWVILLYLGGVGPPIAGIALTYLTGIEYAYAPVIIATISLITKELNKNYNPNYNK